MKNIYYMKHQASTTIHIYYYKRDKPALGINSTQKTKFLGRQSQAHANFQKQKNKASRKTLC